MPELPEVETTIRSLRHQLINQKIKKIEIFYEPIMNHNKNLIDQLIGQTFLRCERKGKFLLFFLSNDWVFIGHLRMEGKIYLRLLDQQMLNKDKHEHFRIFLDNDIVFRYYDVRKFGRFNFYKKIDYLKDMKFKQLALDPFDISINLFYQKLQKSYSNIKQILLNQKIISGIGNIYANEVLFLTRIHPETKARLLKWEQVDFLLQQMRKLLIEAINAGGTSINTFEVNGQKGTFQQRLLVYRKTKCSVCNQIITKIKINGRSSYVCLRCQKYIH
ncbi:MAG: DNA-formamidopyrimidine glycosylase [Vigna little leaf phytoplasma]|nr:DNA-formamidopyrimidine glycosylase [Vigna little leaf phytoplasma]